MCWLIRPDACALPHAQFAPLRTRARWIARSPDGLFDEEHEHEHEHIEAIEPILNHLWPQYDPTESGLLGRERARALALATYERYLRESKPQAVPAAISASALAVGAAERGVDADAFDALFAALLHGVDPMGHGTLTKASMLRLIGTLVGGAAERAWSAEEDRGELCAWEVAKWRIVYRQRESEVSREANNSS